MARRFYANAAPQQVLAAPITNSATSLQVSGSFAGWSATFPFFAPLEYGTANLEIVSVTNIVGTTATIVRGQDGTAAVSHLAGATFDQGVVRQDFDEANAHVNATTGVHGLSGGLVGLTDAQTLSNKTLSTPTLNSPTITNPSATGDATHAALKGRATTAGGKTLSLLNSSSVEKTSVDDAGNLNTATVTTTGKTTALEVDLTTFGKLTGDATSVIVAAQATTTKLSLQGPAALGVDINAAGSATAAGSLVSTADAFNSASAVSNPGGAKSIHVASVSGSTDASGFATVSHGCSFTPSTILGISTAPGSNFAQVWGVDTITSTQCRLRLHDTRPTAPATGAYVSGAFTVALLCIS